MDSLKTIKEVLPRVEAESSSDEGDQDNASE